MDPLEDKLAEILSPLISRNDVLTCEEVLSFFDDLENAMDTTSFPLKLHVILYADLNKIASHLALMEKMAGTDVASMEDSAGCWKVDIRDAHTLRQLCKVYVVLINYNRIPVIVGIQLILKAMYVLYHLEPGQVIESSIFWNTIALAHFIAYAVDDMLPIIKSLGAEFVTEILRVASCIDSLKILPCLQELQNSIDPWDSFNEEGHFVIGEHYEFDNFQRSVHEENESKLDFTSKADVELFNERKKCFDNFSDLHRRWGDRYQGASSSQENIAMLRRDLNLSSATILKADIRNFPWLAKLFVERFLQAEVTQQSKGQALSSSQIPNQTTPLQSPNKQALKTPEVESAGNVQASYANKLKQSLGLTSPVIDTSVLLKLERRLEAHAPSPISIGFTTAPVTAGGLSVSPATNSFTFSSPSTFLGSGSSPFRNNPPQTSRAHIRSNRTPGMNTTATMNAPKYASSDIVLDILFPRNSHFFAYFILECNNFRFIQTTSACVIKLIKQLTGIGLNSEGSKLSGTTLYKGDSLENLVRKLRLLGCLLAYLLCHHLPTNESGLRNVSHIGNSASLWEDEFIVAAVFPVQEMLWEAVQTGSTCLVVPWVCAFLKVLRAFEVGATLGGYGNVAAILYNLQSNQSIFSLSGTDLTSSRLLTLVEIQSLWEEFPSALATAKKALKLLRSDSSFIMPSFQFSGSSCPDNNNYRWTGKILKQLSPSLLEQLESLKRCQSRVFGPPQTPPKADPTSPNTEALQARKQTKRQVIIPVQADSLISGNIANVSNPAFAVPESMSRSSSISLLSVGRQSPIGKVGNSSTLVVKKKTPSKAAKTSLNAASPVFEPAERRRASSSASRATPTLVKQIKSLPPKNLFPDDNKVLLERMEGSFWNQHSNLQSIHSFVFTNTNQSGIAQIKEFMALNLRRVVDEVDRRVQCWCATIVDCGEDFSEDYLLGRWLEFYHDQLIVAGKGMIGKLYASVRCNLGAEYGRYPENERVLKLAVFYTTRHLMQQEVSMYRHLKEYSERKLKELMERKKINIVASVSSSSSQGKRTFKFATVILECKSSTVMFDAINSSCMEDFLSKMVSRGFLCAPQNKDLTSRELDWMFSFDMLAYPSKLLNRIGEASCALVEVGEQLCISCFQCSSNVQSTEDGDVVLVTYSCCQASESSQIGWYKMLLFSFAKTISQVLASRHPSISQELKGKVGIEMTKFLLSSLPILIYIDCLLGSEEIGAVNISRKLMNSTMMMDAALFVDVAINLVARYQVLPLGSFLPVLTALFREKTSAFYEHSKGLVAMSWLMPQGLLFLLARLVIASSGEYSASYRTERYWDGVFADDVRACKDPLEVLTLMGGLLDRISL